MAGITAGDWVTLYRLDAVTGGAGDRSVVHGGVQGSIVSDAAAHPLAEDNLVWVVRATASRSYLVAVDPYREFLYLQVELNAPEPIVTLAIDPTNGDFYGTSEEALYRIDPGTGATGFVGTTPILVDKALGFDLLGNLYGIADKMSSNEINTALVEIDKGTGATSLIADGLYFDDIAARPEDGLLYGIGGLDLFRIDPATGS